MRLQRNRRPAQFSQRGQRAGDVRLNRRALLLPERGDAETFARGRFVEDGGGDGGQRGQQRLHIGGQPGRPVDGLEDAMVDVAKLTIVGALRRLAAHLQFEHVGEIEDLRAGAIAFQPRGRPTAQPFAQRSAVERFRSEIAVEG